MGRIDCGHVAQPIAGERLSGDGYRIVEHDDYIVVAMVDGLGHGPLAHAACTVTLACIESDAELAPDEILRRCHRRTMGQRGTAAAVARLDRRAGKLIYAGVGNIEMRLVGRERVVRGFSVNGVLGQNVQKFVAESHPYTPGDMLVMHTDGISDRFAMTSTSRQRDPQVLAQQLVLEFGRSDDQLLLVMRETT